MVEDVATMALLTYPTGGLITIKYSALQRDAFRLFLSQVAFELRKEGQDVQLLTPHQHEILASNAKIFERKRFIILYDCMRFVDIASELGQQLGQSNGHLPVIIAGTSDEEWSVSDEDWKRFTFMPGATHYVFGPEVEDKADLQRIFQADADNEHRVMRQSEALWAVYRPVALLHALGIPTPLGLLNRFLNHSPVLSPVTEHDIRDVVDGPARGHLLWVGDEANPRATDQLCTVGEVVAQALVERVIQEADAISAYQRFVEVATPAEAMTILKLVRALLQRGRRSLAQALLASSEERKKRLEQLWRDAPVGALIAWAKAYASIGEAQRAHDIFVHGRRRDPDDIRLNHALATFLMDEGQLEEARALLESLDRANLYVRHSLAQLERLTDKRSRQALQFYDDILQEVPKHLPTLVAKADFWLNIDHYDEAQEQLDTALQCDEHNMYALHVLGRLYKAQGKFDEAVQAFRNALDNDPCSVITLHALAELALDRGHQWQTEAALETAKRLQPENVYVLHLWGKFQQECGELHAARETFKQVLKLDPTNVRVLVSYADLLVELGDYVQAEMCLEQAEETKVTDDSIAYIQAVRTSLRLRRRDDDLDIEMPRDLIFRNALAMAYVRRWDIEGDEYQKLLLEFELQQRMLNIEELQWNQVRGKLTQIRTFNTLVEMGRRLRHENTEQWLRAALDADGNNVYTRLLEANCREPFGDARGGSQRRRYRVQVGYNEDTAQFVVALPTLELVNCGETLEEAIRHLQAMLHIHFDMLEEEGRTVPEPTHQDWSAQLALEIVRKD
jgi:tetratricopeptide (TPR) repeat protein